MGIDKKGIYKLALEEIESGKSKYICPALQYAYAIKTQSSTYLTFADISTMFPEFMSFKPQNLTGVVWFKSAEERIDVLKKCIEIL